jgi:pantothenate synthetase
VLAAEPGLSVDYAAVADLDGPTLAAAVRIGHTRLIDNVRLEDEDAAGGG